MATAPKTAMPASPATDTAAADVTPATQPVRKFDLARPFRQMWNFVAGTFGGALEGMARWGARGFTIGGIGGALFGIANYGAVSFLGSVSLGLLGGVVIGIAFGFALGALTGGFTRASRIQAREDAMERMQSRRGLAPFQSASEQIDRINDSNFDRQLQQNQELERNQSYWADRVASGSGQGRGF